MRRSISSIVVLLALYALAPISSAQSPAPAASIQPETLPPALATLRPNEAGIVPILMIHRLDHVGLYAGRPRDEGWGMDPYSRKLFRQDLQWLYDHNYRPISLRDFVRGHIDCPAGKSPFILTFDDSWGGQLWYTAEGKVDPECAVGILDAFHKAHPDWQQRASFFVISGNEDVGLPFYQDDYVKSKLKLLVQEGYDVGDHTITHPHLDKLSDAGVVKEIGGCAAALRRYLPGYDVDTFAMPYGDFPKHRQLLVSGGSGALAYRFTGVVCAHPASYLPVPSPIDKHFDPYRLNRIAIGIAPDQSRWWFDYLEKHPRQKFISDGDPSTFTVPIDQLARIDQAAVAKYGCKLRTYQ